MNEKALAVEQEFLACLKDRGPRVIVKEDTDGMAEVVCECAAQDVATAAPEIVAAHG